MNHPLRVSGMHVRARDVALLFLIALAAPVAHAQIAFENPIGVPYPDRLVFSRIGTLAEPPPENGVHEVSSILVRNDGQEVVNVEALSVSGPFELEDPPALPAALMPGAALELTVRFVAETGNTSNGRRGFHYGTLSVTAGDPEDPLTAELAGYWQRQSQSQMEPELDELIEQIFGYGTTILHPGQHVDTQGRFEAVGDEILSPYWKVADPGEPVEVTPIAAYFECCDQTFTFGWFEQDREDQVFHLLTLVPADAQSVLPRMQEHSGTSVSFAPPAETAFGFVGDDEWTDPMLNTPLATDDCSAGRETCGHRVRIFPAKDRDGIPFPDTYIVAVENGNHYDFNDGVYLVSNVTPAEVGTSAPTAELPSAYALESYPNPFNPRTTIRYALPGASEVRLEVFDTLGRRVAVLVDDVQAAGRHEIPFLADDLTSGIYLARLTAGSLTRSHVLFFVK